MTEQMRVLAELRELSSQTQAAVKEFETALEETPAFLRLKEAKESLKEYNTKADELAAQIKADAVAVCVAGYDAETKTYPKPTISGLALRVNHTMKYDIVQVTEWCKENAKLLFKLDVKEFEKMADKVDVPGVEKIDVPTITIASDLSEYLSQ